MKLLLLLLGGGLGTILRYVMSGVGYKMLGYSMPWGTLLVNVLGAFFIGGVWSYIDVAVLSPSQKLFLFIGFFGGFTTFSSIMLEFLNMVRSGEYIYAMIYVTMTNVLGIIAVFSGFFLGKIIRG